MTEEEIAETTYKEVERAEAVINNYLSRVLNRHGFSVAFSVMLNLAVRLLAKQIVMGAGKGMNIDEHVSLISKSVTDQVNMMQEDLAEHMGKVSTEYSIHEYHKPNNTIN